MGHGCFDPLTLVAYHMGSIVCVRVFFTPRSIPHVAARVQGVIQETGPTGQVAMESCGTPSRLAFVLPAIGRSRSRYLQGIQLGDNLSPVRRGRMSVFLANG